MSPGADTWPFHVSYCNGALISCGLVKTSGDGNTVFSVIEKLRSRILKSLYLCMARSPKEVFHHAMELGENFRICVLIQTYG